MNSSEVLLNNISIITKNKFTCARKRAGCMHLSFEGRMFIKEQLHIPALSMNEKGKVGWDRFVANLFLFMVLLPVLCFPMANILLENHCFLFISFSVCFCKRGMCWDSQGCRMGGHCATSWSLFSRGCNELLGTVAALCKWYSGKHKTYHQHNILSEVEQESNYGTGLPLAGRKKNKPKVSSASQLVGWHSDRMKTS